MDKFDNLKTESDTILLLRYINKSHGFSVMMEVWIYEAIQAQSIISYKRNIEILTD